MKMPINGTADGLSKTIKADYFKMGGANAMPREDGYAATFILTIRIHEEGINQ